MQAFCFIVWLPASTILSRSLFIFPIGGFLTSTMVIRSPFPVAVIPSYRPGVKNQ
jgi:hypothetical protein